MISEIDDEVREMALNLVNTVFDIIQKISKRK